MIPRFSTRRLLLAATLAGTFASGCTSSPFVEHERLTVSFRENLVGQFRTRLAAGVAAPPPTVSVADPARVDEAAWWRAPATAAALNPGAGGATRPAELGELLESTLTHASQIKVFSDLPLIRRTAQAEAQGRFTPRFFAEGKYERTDEPVGSTLQTGGAPRFEEDATVGEVGIRQRLKTGADVTLSERVSYTDNNSVFFLPNPQARAALTLSVVQPLLRGAGAAFNQSVIRIAEIDGEAAQNEFLRQTELHLLEVIRAYHNLYLTRSLYLQQRRLSEAAAGIVTKLEGRGNLDADTGRLVRARAAASERGSGLIRAEMAVRNAEDRLRSLVNAPELYAAGTELIPAAAPHAAPAELELAAAAEAALMSRPEVAQAFDQWRAAALRLDLAENEALPTLDLVAEAAAVGLDGADAGNALGDQFDGGLSYVVGLRFEENIGRGAADARALRRRLELRQQGAQVQTTIETVLLEVRVAVREVQTGWRDLQSRTESLLAAREDLRILQSRFDGGVDAGGTAGATFLDMLLDAQTRQADAEAAVATAQTAYAVSLATLQRAQGTLLKYERLEVQETKDADGLPRLRVGRSDEVAAAADPEVKHVAVDGNAEAGVNLER